MSRIAEFHVLQNFAPSRSSPKRPASAMRNWPPRKLLKLKLTPPRLISKGNPSLPLNPCPKSPIHL